MTQKTSFKSRMKQAFSFFRSDLRACTPLLVVFGLISAVTVVICYTICVVLGDDMTFTGALLSLNFLGVTNSGTGIIEIFQYSSANLIYLISIIFTIIYTVRIYSYLHNKRKADFLGCLHCSRCFSCKKEKGGKSAVGICIPPSVLHNQGACFIPCRHVPRCAFRLGKCSGRICGFCFRIYSCKRSSLHNRSSYFVQRLFKAY